MTMSSYLKEIEDEETDDEDSKQRETSQEVVSRPTKLVFAGNRDS